MPRKELSKVSKQLKKTEKLQKPFGFCCDEKLQDPGTKYDQRKPPFTSSLTDVVLNGGGPDLKFQVKDIFVQSPVSKSTAHKVYLKSTAAHVGACKWSHGPIKWYLEDEISLAQKILRKNKQKNHEDTMLKVLYSRKSN